MNSVFENFYLTESMYPVPGVGEKRRYLLNKDETSELILMIWGPGTKTPIHDHAGSDCWTTLLKGSLLEKTFAKDSLQVIAEESLVLNGMSYVEKDGGLHQLINESSALVYTLHLYQNPLSHCNIFDEETQNWVVLENHYDELPQGER